MTAPTCKTCRWRVTMTSILSECQNPKKPTVREWTWPAVLDTDWCELWAEEVHDDIG